MLRVAPRYAPAHVNLGIVLSRQGKHGQALAHLREAVRLNPRLVPAWTNLGWTLLATGRNAAAAEAFQEALRLVPADSETASLLRSAIEQCGTLDKQRPPPDTSPGRTQTGGPEDHSAPRSPEPGGGTP